jgi:hypothetical protein
MKKSLWLLAVLFSLISCEENVSFNNPSFQGLKDNVFWRAVVSKATVAPDGSVLIEGFTGNEILTLRTTSTALQVYPLGSSDSKAVVYVLSSSNDQISFATGTGFGSGQIVITEYDDEALTISGTFKFSAENTSGNPPAGAVLNFKQGVFYKVPVSLQVP